MLRILLAHHPIRGRSYATPRNDDEQAREHDFLTRTDTASDSPHTTSTPDRGRLTVEWWPIERPLPYARNPRLTPETAIAKVAASLKEYGWRQPIVVDDSGVIVVGHTRLLAAQRLGLTQVPVHVATDLSPAQIRVEVVMAAWREVGLLAHQVLIWKKSRAVLTYSDYLWDYEPMIYGWTQGRRPKMRPPAEAKAVWEIASSIEDGAGGIHPTQKPIELVRRPISCHTKPGGLIYEPF